MPTVSSNRHSKVHAPDNKPTNAHTKPRSASVSSPPLSPSEMTGNSIEGEAWFLGKLNVAELWSRLRNKPHQTFGVVKTGVNPRFVSFVWHS